MISLTYDETLKLLSILSSSYPNFELKKSTVQVYAKCLEDIPFNIGQAAALSHITHKRYFPTISELREAALNVSSDKRLPEPEEAWAIVSEAIRKHGLHGAPTFNCKAIADTVKQVGWYHLCTSESLIAERSYFLKLYSVHAKRTKDEFIELPSVKALASGIDEPLYLPQTSDDTEFLKKYGTN